MSISDGQDGIQDRIQNGIQDGIQDGVQNGVQNGIQNGIQDGVHDGIHNGTQDQSATTNNICSICGDKAIVINYGALSCFSCRTFFRRNALPTKEMSCRYDGQCEVNMLTRKFCAPCRLMKCLSIGMTPDLIRKEDLTGKKRKSGNAKTEENNVMTIPQESTLDLPADGTLLYLSGSDRTLISNVMHAFDTFSPISEVRRTIETLNKSASNLPYGVSQSLDLISSFYNSLKLFISSTPDFQVLTSAEQCSLYQRNMLGVLCIGGMYFMRESGIFDQPENEMVILPLYGTELIQQAKVICQQLNCDPVLFKLMLIALAFSSNCYMIDNRGRIDRDSLLSGTFRLFGSQNVYVELMWKYLMHTYGYNNSVRRLSTLVKQLLHILKFSIDMYENNQIHQTFIDGRIEQTETCLVVDDKSTVPLWGKDYS